MGCNCGKGRAGSGQFEYTAPGGKKTIYHTEMEAKAAVMRYGGTQRKVN